MKYLIYNKYNGRIGSLVKSFEKQNYELNAEEEKDKKLIEKFLWESKVDRNKSTEDSLVEVGQQRPGIVTNDGIIIDGNRRALLLNRIYAEKNNKWKKHNVASCEFFIAIILPDDADEKEIQRLETTYQMGEDEKLGYNPVEKYLKCKDLKAIGFKPAEIAKMMGEKSSKVDEWLEIMTLMDNYLTYLGYEGIYTRLEKTEGPFVDLCGYLKKYDKGTNLAAWNIKDMDINELKLVCFDYIRGRYEGKEFRNIAKPSKKESIFCKSKELWEDFLEEHKTNIRVIEEEDVQKIRNENPDEDMTKVLEARDMDWKKKSKGPMEGNFKKHFQKLENLNEADKPFELVKRSLSALSSINTESDEFYEEPGVYDKLKDIMRMAAGYVRTIEKWKKQNK